MHGKHEHVQQADQWLIYNGIQWTTSNCPPGGGQIFRLGHSRGGDKSNLNLSPPRQLQLASSFIRVSMQSKFASGSFADLRVF